MKEKDQFIQRILEEQSKELENLTKTKNPEIQRTELKDPWHSREKSAIYQELQKVKHKKQTISAEKFKISQKFDNYKKTNEQTI